MIERGTINFEFQFLIGRLKTSATSHAKLVIPVLFQFLIGRLKTLRQNRGKAMADRFQFLIGRLKTAGTDGPMDRGADVSIPYR